MSDTDGRPVTGPPPPGEGPGPAAPPRQPAFNVPPITLGLVGAVAVGFAALTWGPVWLADGAYQYLTVVPARVVVAIHDPLRPNTVFAALSLVTHVFIHFQGVHVALNLGFLLAFGSGCERALGTRRFALLALASAVAGAAAQVAADWGQVVFMFGASGMVSGCIGGFLRLLLAMPGRRRQALAMLAVLVGFNALFAIVGPQMLGIDGQIAWQAHLGGFVAGLLLGYPPRRRRTMNRRG